MFAFLLPALGFAKANWKLFVGFVMGALMCWPIASCDGRKVGRQQMVVALERANRAAMDLKAHADELAANQRLTDTIAVNRQEQELRNAIANTPDSAPDATRIALGCSRLRASGQRTDAIPACRGSGRGSQAGSAR